MGAAAIWNPFALTSSAGAAHRSHVTREINCGAGVGSPFGTPQIRPRLVTFACADFENGVSQITWLSWKNSIAVGLGTLTVDLCDPACVNGPTATWRAVIALEDPVETPRFGMLFTRLVAAQLTPNPLAIKWPQNGTGAATPSTFPLSRALPKSAAVIMLPLVVPGQR